MKCEKIEEKSDIVEKRKIMNMNILIKLVFILNLKSAYCKYFLNNNNIKLLITLKITDLSKKEQNFSELVTFNRFESMMRLTTRYWTMCREFTLGGVKA